jgi:pyruvate/2-oxoacid:ferredoxin oxidoreductase alpha subunit
MPKYLVGFSDSESQEQDFKMIEASSANEAIDTFIQTFAIAEDLFVEYV